MISKVRESALIHLLFSEGANTVASLIATVALPIIAVTILRATPVQVGLLVAASSSAPLLFGLSAGVLASKLELRSTLTWCGLARIALLLVVPLAILVGVLNVYVLGLVGFGISTVRLVHDSAMSAAVPSIARPDDLTKANGWIEGVTSASEMIGPALCGLLLGWTSVTTVFLTGIAIYALGTWEIRKAMRAVKAEANDDNGELSHLSDIAFGIGLLWKNEIQRTIALSASLFNLFHTAFFTVFTVFAVRDLQLTASSLGVLLSSIGALGLIGALGAEKISTFIGLRTALVGSLIIIGPLGIPILVAAHLDLPYRMGLVALCLGAWDFAIVVHLVIEQTIRQATVPIKHLSRVAATTRFVSWGADPLGALLGGVAAGSVLGARGTLAVCLFGMTVAGSALLLSAKVRHLNASSLAAAT